MTLCSDTFIDVEYNFKKITNLKKAKSPFFHNTKSWKICLVFSHNK